MAASAQVSDLGHGVEEITPELIERRQTLISPDDLEGEVTAAIYCVCGMSCGLVMVVYTLSQMAEQ
jgi:hypothetical protein